MHIVCQLETAPWRRFLEQNPNASIYHTPEMFQVFSQTRGHKPELWSVVSDEGEVLALITPVQIALMSGWLRDFTVRAVSYGGLLSTPNAIGFAACKYLLDAYQNKVDNHVLFTELRNQYDVTPYQALLGRKGYMYQPHLNFLIDLGQTQEILWSKINKSGRNRIRAAGKKGLQIKEGSGPDAIDAAYMQLGHVYTRIGVPLADRSLFRAAWDILAPRDMLKIFLAYADGNCIGARVLLLYKDCMIDWYAGADRNFAAYSPNEALVWHVLEWGKASGYKTFDFGGGGNPDEPYGPREFKLKFGGAQVNYGRNVCIHSQLRFNLSKAGYDFYRRLPRRSRIASISDEP